MVVFISLPEFLCRLTPTIPSPEGTKKNQTLLWPMQYGEQMSASHNVNGLAFMKCRGSRRYLGNSGEREFTNHVLLPFQGWGFKHPSVPSISSSLQFKIQMQENVTQEAIFTR